MTWIDYEKIKEPIEFRFFVDAGAETEDALAYDLYISL